MTRWMLLGGAEVCCVPLVKVCPDMDDEHHYEEHAPARERAETTREAGLIEKEADADGAEDL